MTGRAVDRGALDIAAVLLVTVVAPLNATMIVVALPALLADLRADPVAGSLLVAGYLVPMAILPPLGGRLGDRLGRGRLLLTGLGVFGGASLGAACAPALTVVLGFRTLQAVGAALAFPNALALLRERLPAPARGLGFGLVGAAMALSAAAGPALGLLLLGHGGWRWVFAVNVPLVALGALTARAAFGGTGLVGRAASERGPGGAGANGRLAAATVAMALSNLALYAALVGVPLLLGAASGGSQSGFLLTALLVAAALAAPVSGRLAHLRGRRAAATAGLSLLAAGLLPMALAGQRLGPTAMAAVLAMAGVGLGTSSTAIQTVGIEAAGGAHAGAAAGLLSTSRYLGGAAGSGILPLVLMVAPAEPLQALFAVAAAAAALGAAAGLRIA